MIKNRLFYALLLIAFFFTTQVNAIWAKMTDQQLVDASVLVVEAELIGITKITVKNNQSIRVGVLQVRSIYKGKPDGVVLIQLHKAEKPISSSDLNYQVGQKGIWFLRSSANSASGIYFADNPQRLWHSDQIDRLKAIINKTSD